VRLYGAKFEQSLPEQGEEAHRNLNLKVLSLTGNSREIAVHEVTSFLVARLLYKTFYSNLVLKKIEERLNFSHVGLY